MGWTGGTGWCGVANVVKKALLLWGLVLPELYRVMFANLFSNIYLYFACDLQSQ